MKLRIFSRILLATLPATATVMALTTGTASAMPRDPCQDYANEANEYYGEYQYWYGESMDELDAGHPDAAISDAQIAVFWREGYESVLSSAYDYGCF